MKRQLHTDVTQVENWSLRKDAIIKRLVNNKDNTHSCSLFAWGRMTVTIKDISTLKTKELWKPRRADIIALFSYLYCNHEVEFQHLKPYEFFFEDPTGRVIVKTILNAQRSDFLAVQEELDKHWGVHKRNLCPVLRCETDVERPGLAALGQTHDRVEIMAAPAKKASKFDEKLSNFVPSTTNFTHLSQSKRCYTGIIANATFYDQNSFKPHKFSFNTHTVKTTICNENEAINSVNNENSGDSVIYEQQNEPQSDKNFSCSTMRTGTGVGSHYQINSITHHTFNNQPIYVENNHKLLQQDRKVPMENQLQAPTNMEVYTHLDHKYQHTASIQDNHLQQQCSTTYPYYERSHYDLKPTERNERSYSYSRINSSSTDDSGEHMRYRHLQLSRHVRSFPLDNQDVYACIRHSHDACELKKEMIFPCDEQSLYHGQYNKYKTANTPERSDYETNDDYPGKTCIIPKLSSTSVQNDEGKMFTLVHAAKAALKNIDSPETNNEELTDVPQKCSLLSPPLSPQQKKMAYNYASDNHQEKYFSCNHGRDINLSSGKKKSYHPYDAYDNGTLTKTGSAAPPWRPW
eukprot:Awhi_evm1s14433